MRVRLVVQNTNAKQMDTWILLSLTECNGRGRIIWGNSSPSAVNHQNVNTTTSPRILGFNLSSFCRLYFVALVIDFYIYNKKQTLQTKVTYWVEQSNNKQRYVILVFNDSILFEILNESHILFQVWEREPFLVSMWISPHKANFRFPFWQFEFQFLPSTYHLPSIQAVSLAHKGQSSPIPRQFLPSTRGSSVLSASLSCLYVLLFCWRYTSRSIVIFAACLHYIV